MIERAIYELLKGDQDINALVAGRITPGQLLQATAYPAITVSVAAGGSAYSMDGSSHLADPRVQIDIYAETNAAVVNLKNKVMAALSGFRGSAGGIEIQGAFRVMEVDGIGDQLDRTNPRVWRKTLDFIVWHKE